MSYELATYEPADREAYLGLLGEAWDDRTMTADEFDWWFGRNPAGSLMSVARMDGRVVGVAAHSLARMVLDGEERVASFSVHATTHASARGQGIFAELERKHEREAAERGVAVVLAFASAPTAPIFLGPLGLDRDRPAARLGQADARRRRAAPAAVEPFAAPQDTAAGWPNHVVRDAELPQLALRRLAARLPGRPHGVGPCRRRANALSRRSRRPCSRTSSAARVTSCAVRSPSRGHGR